MEREEEDESWGRRGRGGGRMRARAAVVFSVGREEMFFFPTIPLIASATA